MPTEMPKAYDPAAVQAEVAGVWDAEKAFHAEPTDPGEPYSVVIPPPNVTAALHLGHALNNTVQDILIRKARMEGKNAVWLPGTDHAGIATQTVVEKRVLKEENRRRTDFPREEFVAKIQTWKDEYEKVILGQIRAMGASCDWDRTAFTMDEQRAKAVREAFFRLFKEGLIYRGKRLVNWDPATQTALADDEVENEEVDGFFYYLKYPVCDAQGNDECGMMNDESKAASADSSFITHHSSLNYITVATTRPETMLGDTAVAINPRDPRAAALRGKFVKLPIVGRIIPIIEDDYVVMPVAHGGDPADVKAQFASGFLKVTPAHDPNDWDIGLRHGLPVINVMAPDASISDQHGWSQLEGPGGVGEASFLLGQSREAAREAVVEWFRRHDLLGEVKPYRHSVGHSYRSHVPIEPYLSDQWYCRVTDDRLRGAALRAMDPAQRSGPVGATPASPVVGPLTLAGDAGVVLTTNTVTFYPARYAKSYQTWNENLRDWCISRQLWWGHRIPVWKKNLNLGIGFESSESADVPFTPTFLLQFSETEWCQHMLAGTEGIAVSVRPGNQVIELALEEHGFVQDPDVLDTWFSSGLWPMSTLGWPDANAAALAKWNPTTVLTTAREIITLWVSRMVMFNQFFLGRVPFRDVYIHTVVQDGEGRKMSKSLNNGVDPLDVIHTHGADALRYTLTSICTNTQDVRMPVERDPVTGRNGSPKFDSGRNFANKIWNAARFVIGQISAVGWGSSPPPDAADGGKVGMNPTLQDVPSAHQVSKVLTLTDLWILSRLNRAITEANASIADYRFDQYAKIAYDFFWGDFCDWYVEASKPQMKDPTRQASTARVLASVLDASLRLLHPMMPFVTEKIWWRLNEVAPERGVMGQIACPPAERCIKAQWPKASGPRAGDLAESAEHIFGKIQEIVVAIRTLRSDYKVDAKKSVAVSIKCGEDASHRILSLKASIELLAVCSLGEVGEAVAAPEKAASVPAGGCEVYVEGLVDPAAEEQRKVKRREELTREIAALKGRLGNAGYIAKAPPKLVKETQDSLAEKQAELDGLS